MPLFGDIKFYLNELGAEEKRGELFWRSSIYPSPPTLRLSPSCSVFQEAGLGHVEGFAMPLTSSGVQPKGAI